MNKKTEPRRFVFTAEELNRLHGINRQLLEACHDLVDTLRCVTAYVETRENDKRMRDESITKAEAAIAAAEGKENA